MAASAAARQLGYGTYGSAGVEHAPERDFRNREIPNDAGAVPAEGEQSQVREHGGVQIREKQKVSVVTTLGLVMVLVLAFLVLMGNAQLYVFSRQISEVQSSLDQLETKHAQLMRQYETIYDSETVQAVAEAAGMRIPGSGQIFYVDLSGGDSAEVLQKGEEESTLAEDVVSATEDKISAVTEYLN